MEIAYKYIRYYLPSLNCKFNQLLHRQGLNQRNKIREINTFCLNNRNKNYQRTSKRLKKRKDLKRLSLYTLKFRPRSTVTLKIKYAPKLEQAIPKKKPIVCCLRYPKTQKSEIHMTPKIKLKLKDKRSCSWLSSLAQWAYSRRGSASHRWWDRSRSARRRHYRIRWCACCHLVGREFDWRWGRFRSAHGWNGEARIHGVFKFLWLAFQDRRLINGVTCYGVKRVFQFASKVPDFVWFLRSACDVGLLLLNFFGELIFQCGHLWNKEAKRAFKNLCTQIN